eukprot:CAMPEP_0170358118 /NCGR_PEP_ID=MMETSP0117_2-20130122/2062_1 /TAXON_ID=400756 /ORGANISM="Durinskia baltica, Strain CSIRO CS-38" /LENGTH=36 /DNA_ID= /DNA_START= /DNA_END= /DNA_ORIENTATION=
MTDVLSAPEALSANDPAGRLSDLDTPLEAHSCCGLE